MSKKNTSLSEIFLTALKLGLTSFGGPVAHIGFFHNEYVKAKKWLDEHTFADLTALCQFLPGPASSQLGISIGILRGGISGGLAAWAGFTLPSALLMGLFAFFIQNYKFSDAGWLHGLKLVAVAVVFQAVSGMWIKLAGGAKKGTYAVLSMAAVILWQGSFTQLAVILIAGTTGYFLLKNHLRSDNFQPDNIPKKSSSILFLVIFIVMLVIIPFLLQFSGSFMLTIFESFYRSGSLVFGGGHVVLPLLEKEVVPPGWINTGDFLAGYGAAQAVPGPLFTFSAYLGAMIAGPAGAVIALGAIFLPSFLLVAGILPFWDDLRKNNNLQGVLSGVNASVVGILAAALYDPLWKSSITGNSDFVIVVILSGLLIVWKMPPWFVVISGIVAGILK